MFYLDIELTVSFKAPVSNDDPVEFVCSWNSVIDLEKEVIWYRQLANYTEEKIWNLTGGNQLGDEGEQKYFHVDLDMYLTEYKLTLMNASMWDEGEYWCTFTVNLLSEHPNHTYQSNKETLDVLGE